jgi:3-oxoacyl-[acyl-carrier protein] reductase
MEDLLGKISIVTGGAMGIGREIALRLAQDGSDIAVVDVEKEEGQKTAEEVRSMGRKSLFLEVDVTQWDQVRAMVDGVLKRFNKVDILVNSAGILGPLVPLWEYSVEDWDRVMGINLRGTFLCSKAVIVPMLDQKSGRIVNISSIAGKEGNPKMNAYSTSKAAVIGFTKSLAKEVAQENIIVVAALVKFLVSEECAFSTGQCFDISGGRAVY